jgi:hypothetical protein
MGTLSDNAVAMEIKGAVAVLKGTTLTLWLLPFAPTAEETAKLQANDFIWLFGKPSPDPKRWTGCPFGQVTVTAEKGNRNTTIQSYGVGGENSNLTAIQSAVRFAVSLTGQVKEGQEVRLTTKGSSRFADKTLGWDLNLKAKVLASTRK